MGTCPNCGISSRVAPQGFTAEQVLVAKPVGSVLLSGSTMKTVATEKIRLKHSCGWTAIGHIEGSNYVIESQEVIEGGSQAGRWQGEGYG